MKIIRNKYETICYSRNGVFVVDNVTGNLIGVY